MTKYSRRKLNFFRVVKNYTRMNKIRNEGMRTALNIHTIQRKEYNNVIKERRRPVSVVVQCWCTSLC